MIERSLIKIDSKHINENHIQFLKHQKRSNNLVVIFPGGDNSTDIPTLHYARKAALLVGCDVLSLKYGVSPSKLDFQDKNLYMTLIEECFIAMNRVNFREYEKIFFISKSIGNLIAIDVDNEHFNSEVTHIFYTPVEALIDKIQDQNCIVFTGEKDKFIKKESISLLKKCSNTKVYQFPNAVHSLEVNDDISESFRILESVTEILSEYLEKTVKSDRKEDENSN